MKIQLLVWMTFILISADAFAEGGVSYKVAGRGIQDQTTKEIVLMACVGESVLSNERDCNVLQLLQIKPEINPVWLGNPFHAGDIPQIREQLSQWYSEKSLDGMFSFLKGDTTYAFSDKDGWNWSNNPLVLETGKFSKVVSTVLYFAEYQHSLENEQKRKNSAKDAMVTEQGIQGYRGVFLSRVKERNSKRSIIYSVTDTEVVISLFSRGIIKELKALKIDKAAETIELRGAQYQFELTAILTEATAESYEWCFPKNGDATETPAFFLVIFTPVMLPLCAILPGLPFLTGVALSPIDGAITLISKLGKEARAKRKFAQIMREKDVKTSHRVFDSMIEQIKAIEQIQ